MKGKNRFKKGDKVFFIAKNGKTIRTAKVVSLVYRVADESGKTTYVEAKAVADTPEGLARKMTLKAKERICLAYFRAIDALADSEFNKGLAAASLAKGRKL